MHALVKSLNILCVHEHAYEWMRVSMNAQMYECVCTNVYARVWVCGCVHMRECVYMFACTYALACVMFVRECVRAKCVCVCVLSAHAWMIVHARVNVRECEFTHAHACLSECVRARGGMRECAYMHVRTCMRVYTNVSVSANVRGPVACERVWLCATIKNGTVKLQSRKFRMMQVHINVQLHISNKHYWALLYRDTFNYRNPISHTGDSFTGFLQMITLPLYWAWNSISCLM